MQRGGVHCGEFVVRRLKIWRRRGENVTRLPATTPAEPPIRQTQGVVGMHCTDEETRVYLLETRDTGPHEAMGNESSPSPLEKSYTVLREVGGGYWLLFLDMERERCSGFMVRDQLRCVAEETIRIKHRRTCTWFFWRWYWCSRKTRFA